MLKIYSVVRRCGDAMTVDETGEHIVITLKGHQILIDHDDKDLIEAFTWSVLPDGYVALHRVIETIYGKVEHRTNLGRAIVYKHSKCHLKKNFEVDHKNRNKQDNRRSNLRIANPTQNSANRVYKNKTGFKGVRKAHNRYVASIGVRRKKIQIGRFDSAEEAAKAYDREARKLWGEFALLNFPDAL